MSNGRNVVRRVFKIDRRTFFDPAAWFDYAYVSEFTRTIVDIIRAAFFLPRATPAPEVQQETFEQAMARQNVTENDIKDSLRLYRIYSILLLIGGILDFCYSFYLLFGYGSLLGFIIGIVSTALFFGQAFRFDFWAYQLKQRRLGVTFKEWRDHKLGVKENPR